MAVRGTATKESLTPSYVGELFREVHRALADAAAGMESGQQKTGF
jgi:hypothetical protein